MQPTHRIAQGLSEAAAGIVDLREELERNAVLQGQRREHLVDAEFRLRTISLQAMRARQPRHLQPQEVSGPRAQYQDGPPSSGSVDEKPYWQTVESLRKMGLTRTSKEPTPKKVRALLDRLFDR